jgi:choline dehydrogenase-like flavoprotein
MRHTMWPSTVGLVAENYDVIIVGSGAGGGTLAHTLAPSGKRILLLERGDFLPREIENWGGAALYRLRPEDFGDLRHADGLSPAWPLSYDEFEPWYTKAEWLYQVHGTHGEDPTEGHCSKEYPWPAVSHERRGLCDDAPATETSIPTAKGHGR